MRGHIDQLSIRDQITRLELGLRSTVQGSRFKSNRCLSLPRVSHDPQKDIAKDYPIKTRSIGFPVIGEEFNTKNDLVRSRDTMWFCITARGEITD